MKKAACEPHSEYLNFLYGSAKKYVIRITAGVKNNKDIDLNTLTKIYV